jgi:hypothetical protein
MVPAEMPCTCGGTMKRVQETGERDVTDLIGIPSVLTGKFTVLRCERCGEVSLPGFLLEEVAWSAVLMLLRLPRRLAGIEAQFLRKAAFMLTPQELAEKAGVAVEAVRAWEAARSLSPREDFELRSLVLGRLLRVSRDGKQPWARFKAELLRLSEDVLEGIRGTAAPELLVPYRFNAPIKLAA